MDERKKRILQAIIQDYVKSAEPVGSRTLARNYELGISPATVRNEMSDLEQLGFLEQPHTSAGRIPSAKGYRFYVDTILSPVFFKDEDILQINRLWKEREGSFEDFFLETAKLISQVSHNMSMFLAPSNDRALFRYVHILPLDGVKAILVVVTDAYALDNEVLNFGETVDKDVLANIAQKITNVLHDVPLQSFDERLGDKLLDILKEPKGVLNVVIQGMLRALSKRKFIYSIGTLELLGQPEFKSYEKMHPLLSFLEEKEQIGKLLSSSESPITIRIGAENEETSIKDCTLIQADFSVAGGRVGTLAILGPTRMEYARFLIMLRYMQHFIEKIE